MTDKRTIRMGLKPSLALVALLASQTAIPGERALVASVGEYVAAYARDFVELVADEHTRQEAAINGKLVGSRTTRGELFATFIPGDDVWMSVHDITEVDGVPAPAHESVRQLLTRESLSAVAPLVAAANARYNLGSVRRNFNEPTLGLLPFTRRYLALFDFDRGTIDRSTPGTPLVTMEFRDRNGNAIVRSEAGRVRLRGSAVVEATTGRVHRTSLTLADGRGSAKLDTVYAFDAHVERWVPTEFTEEYADPRSGEVTTVKTRFSNYRRFGVSVRFK